MIITRTPLRISLGGGGTDLPSYYEKNGHGFLVTAAINKYIYIAAHENFENKLLLKYSQLENVESVDEVTHPIIREALKATGDWKGLEISSMADIPAGTGLGSSGSFTVGLLKALRSYKNIDTGNIAIAEEACDIEITKLKEPSGKQDQYIAAKGGICKMHIEGTGEVKIQQLDISFATKNTLEDNLVLFYTGVRRSASEALLEEQRYLDQASLQKSLDRTRELGYSSRDVLESNDLGSFAQLLTEQWIMKYQRQPSKVHNEINELIQGGIANGALGGKLIGAGGGGFLLFYAVSKSELRNYMNSKNLVEIPFQFDHEGSTVIVSQ
jgi:D-glycero-alpha-D-manno-heptose-7-phosphate kinase